MMQQTIDSHFHIWRQQDQPWLMGPMVPRIFGPYEPIRRDYPMTLQGVSLSIEPIESRVKPL